MVDASPVRAAIAAARAALDEAERLADLAVGQAVEPVPSSTDAAPAELPPLFDPAIGPDVSGPEWVTPQQAAGLMRCGARVIYDRLRAGEPIGMKVAGRWYVDRGRLSKLIQAPSRIPTV